MHVTLINQPDASSSNLFEFVSRCITDPDLSRIVAVTAWVNHRGLARLIPDLRAFRARPATAEIVLGIDEGGATEQGLRLAAAEFDRSFVFFAADDRTFHPKLYFGSGATKARLLVGSNNLTPGGLFFNFEAALVVELSRGPGAPVEDTELIHAVEGFLDRLTSDTAVCKPLAPILEDVIRNPSYGVRDESQPRSRRGTQPSDPDADRDVLDWPAIFGRSALAAKPRLPAGETIPPSELIPGLVPPAAPRTRAAPPPPLPARVMAPTAVRHRWFRSLDATAAQHPPNVASSPTGNLRLTQAGHGVDQTTYFRNELFGGLAWRSETVPQGIREATSVSMEVVLDGRGLGTRVFDISHAGHREAGQGNVTTVIHLAPIGEELRATNYAGRVVTIEQLSSGEYRLTIDPAETGPFAR